MNFGIHFQKKMCIFFEKLKKKKKNTWKTLMHEFSFLIKYKDVFVA